MCIDSDAAITVTSADPGSGSTDNAPDDVTGYSDSGVSSFTCASSVCI